MTQPQLEAVAQAIKAHWTCECGEWAEDFDEHCLHVAQAALDALQLTVETGLDDWSTATGHVCTCDADDMVDEFHSCERGQHGGETFPVTRLVSPWLAVPQQENRK